MKKTKVKNLYQLSFLPVVFPINVYIYEEDDFLTVIDMGLGRFVKPIKDISEQTNKSVKNLLLTHAHSDHVMGVSKFREAFPEAKVYMSRREHRFVNDDFKFDENESSFEKKGDYSKLDFDVDQHLEESDTVGSLEVISTPGHSVGSISYLDKKQNILIAGDAFQSKGRFAVSGDLVWMFPFPAMATGSKKVALKSAKKIQSLNLDVLALGHGKIIENAAPSIDEAIRRSES